MALAHWWNGSWGTMSRRDVWLDQLDDGRFEIRWRGPNWRDRDGRYWTADPHRALDALKHLLGEENWRELPVGAAPPERATPPEGDT